MASPPSLYKTIYGNGDVEDAIEKYDLERQNGDTLNEAGPSGCRAPSLYVAAFEEMINVVNDGESDLFSDQEWDVFSTFSRLCYNARYCLVRLILRKKGSWHTVSSMERFKGEVGEEGLARAVSDLCRPFNAPKAEPMDLRAPVKEEECEIIDLSFDPDDKANQKTPDFQNAKPGPSRLEAVLPENVYCQDIKPTINEDMETLDCPASNISDSYIDFFCEDETSMSLYEILWKLNVQQLKTLVKSTKSKLRNKDTKPELISTLLHHASRQSVLCFRPVVKSRRRVKDDGSRQTQLPFPLKPRNPAAPENQERRLLQMALKMLGKCVRVNPSLIDLVNRVNIVADRATEYPEKPLTHSILTLFKKRTYAEYKYTRDNTIWLTREEVLNYTEALYLDALIKQELESNKPDISAKTPGADSRGDFATPSTVWIGRGMTTPIETPGRSSAARCTETPTSVKKEDHQATVSKSGEDDTIGEIEEPLRIKKARKVKKVFEEQVFPQWKDLVASMQDQERKIRSPGLERFETGFVYTRIISKATYALGVLKEYEAELKVLNALLGQRYWRRRKRGKWYERRAVILTRYLCITEDGKDECVLRQAMVGVKEALMDEDTGIVSRPSLVRRLRALEKKLRVPEDERCYCEGELRKVEARSFNAIRVWTTKGLILDGNGRPKEKESNIVQNNQSGALSLVVPASDKQALPDGAKIKSKPPSPSDNWIWKGKSIWKGRDGEEVNVEIRALQYYEDLGFKGFHSESSVLTTIFALLFWDIMFSDVKGAFETPYQDAPLDLFEDSFYFARKDLIDKRLAEINGGMAQEILEKHDEKHRVKKTRCIGTRWDICEKQDLIEILQCLGGGSLAVICQLFCEDYAGRRSGVPDLIIWNAEQRLCKFVEVKGPGDTPQENQKLWFDSLLGAGAHVEICKVFDESDTKSTSKSKKPGSKAKYAGSDIGPESAEEQLDPPEGENYKLPNQSNDSALGKRKRGRFVNDDDDDYLPTFTPDGVIITHPSMLPPEVTSYSDGNLPPKKQKLAMYTSP